MQENFLGTGWRFPVSANKQGGISMSAYEEDVREAIWIILSTAKGERIMRPDFGCGIYDLVFSVLNMNTYSLIESTVRDALIEWEPRIKVINVTARPKPSDDCVLNIMIDYEVRTTNSRYNLVYPFFINE